MCGRRQSRRIAAAALCAALIPAQALAAGDEGGAPLTAGASRVEITPAAASLRPGDIIRDALYARAIVVRDGGSCAVLVGLDQSFVSEEVFEAAGRRASEATGCARENILMTATHTHSGGGAARDAEIEDAIVQAVEQAYDSLRPASLGYGTRPLDLNINRDAFVNGRWMQAPNPQGASDKTLAVAALLGEDDLPIGVFMNYAMHPINFHLAGVISGDFAGEASRYIEGRYDNAVAIFSQGASGDQNPRMHRPLNKLIRTRTGAVDADDDRLTAPPPWVVMAAERNAPARMAEALRSPVPEDRVEAYRAAIETTSQVVAAEGVIIGETAIDVMRYSTPRRTTEAAIAGLSRSLTCPGRDRLDTADPVRDGAAPPYADGAPVEIRVGALRLGEIYFVSVNGEVYSEIGTRLREESPASSVMMVTVANGRANSGYIYSDAAGDHLTFQVIGSRLRQGCAEDAIVEAGLEMIRELAAARP